MKYSLQTICMSHMFCQFRAGYSVPETKGTALNVFAPFNDEQ